ncbi:MAG: hypothetical protein LUQ37_08455 [Methanoregulaceae archaeon]|nr:hypothetical protein [Methanoregulaceae archaeon]
MEPAGNEGRITIARNVVTDRCERCGRVLLLNMVKEKNGRTMLWCRRCISVAGIEGLVDPLKTIRWPDRDEYCEKKNI